MLHSIKPRSFPVVVFVLIMAVYAAASIYFLYGVIAIEHSLWSLAGLCLGINLLGAFLTIMLFVMSRRPSVKSYANHL